MTTCDMSSEQSLGIEKTSVENFRASSGTRTGTDAFEGRVALQSRRRESHFPFGNVAVIIEPVGNRFALGFGCEPPSGQRRGSDDMVTLASLATAGLVLGMFFNVYALAGSCVAVVLLNFASAFDVGISMATLSFALVIIFLQIGYFAGLLVSGLFIPQRLHRSLHREDDAEKFL